MNSSFLRLLPFVIYNDFLQRLNITPKRHIANLDLLPPDSLLRFASNQYSQSGQDGILCHLIDILHLDRPTFMEFGAWDGEYLSNCRTLLDAGSKGLMVELDSSRFCQLSQLASRQPTLQVCLTEVGQSYPHRWSDIFQNFFPNTLPNILSIDIDGLDLEVFLAGNALPDILVIEGGSAFHPCISSPSPSPSNGYQHPFGYIYNQLIACGMTPVCFCQDTFAVRTDLLDHMSLDITTYSAEELFSHYWTSLPFHNRAYVLYKRATDTFISDFEASHHNCMQSSSFAF